MITTKEPVNLDIAGQHYRLVFDVNAACELETALSTPSLNVSVGQALELAKTGHIRSGIAFLWAMLQREHADQFPTIKSVTTWIDASGGPEKLNDALIAVGEAMARSAEPVKRPARRG